MSSGQFPRNPQINPAKLLLPILVGVGLLVVVILVSQMFVRVEVGHVAVSTLFGKPKSSYEQGIHMTWNPLLEFHHYDARQKSHLETAQVPSQDQLQTTIDVSVQYRIIKSMAPSILEDTGLVRELVAVHLVPKLRSSMREQGKTIKRAEDFFLEETQEKLQDALFLDLEAYLRPKGLEVQAVLIRDIQLPGFITKAIAQKKEREQAVERQRAELERYRLEQQQEVAQAEAARDAATQQAETIKLLADAKAYEIQAINKAISGNKSYIQLQSLEALKAISKDPASKVYFLDGNSPSPLPLMHIGEK